MAVLTAALMPPAAATPHTPQDGLQQEQLAADDAAEGGLQVDAASGEAGAASSGSPSAVAGWLNPGEEHFSVAEAAEMLGEAGTNETGAQTGADLFEFISTCQDELQTAMIEIFSGAFVSTLLQCARTMAPPRKAIRRGGTPWQRGPSMRSGRAVHWRQRPMRF